MNSSVSPRARAAAIASAALAGALAACRRRSRRRRASCGPSAGRGPWRSSGRPPCRSCRRGAASPRAARGRRARTSGQRVASVRERVDDEVGNALARRQLDKRLQVLEARSARRRRRRGPSGGACRAGPRARPRTPRASASFSKKLPSAIAPSMRARSCWTTDAGAQVQVADLRVAHLAFGKADVAAPTCAASYAGRPARARRTSGVAAWPIALPGPGGAMPQPSRITSATAGTGTPQGRAEGSCAPPPGRWPRSPRGRGTRRRPARRRRRAGPAAPRRCRASSSRRRGSATASAASPPSRADDRPAERNRLLRLLRRRRCGRCRWPRSARRRRRRSPTLPGPTRARSAVSWRSRTASVSSASRSASRLPDAQDRRQARARALPGPSPRARRRSRRRAGGAPSARGRRPTRRPRRASAPRPRR